MPRKPKQKSGEAVEHSAGSVGSLYEVLELEKDASQDEIRKAYHRMALRLHPDKNPGDEGAKERFQTLQHVFSILGDPEKRQLYDLTGSVDDAELGGQQCQDLYSFIRQSGKKLTVEDIEKFEDEYRGSNEELQDLKQLYERLKGNMKLLEEWMMCCSMDLDSHRFKDAIEQAIAAGELKSYKKFRTWAAAVAKKPAPKDPLEAFKRKRKKRTETPAAGIADVVRKRQAERSSQMLEVLAAKYGKAAEEPVIDDEEFAAIQKRLFKKKTSKR